MPALVAFIEKRLDEELALRDAPVKLIPPEDVAGQLWTECAGRAGQCPGAGPAAEERVDVDLIRGPRSSGFVQHRTSSSR